MIERIKQLLTRGRIKLGLRHETAIFGGRKYDLELIEALNRGGHLYSWVASYQGQDEFVSIRFSDPASAEDMLVNFKIYITNELKATK